MFVSLLVGDLFCCKRICKEVSAIFCSNMIQNQSVLVVIVRVFSGFELSWKKGKKNQHLCVKELIKKNNK